MTDQKATTIHDSNKHSRGPNFTISFLLIGLGIILLADNLGLTLPIDWDSFVPYWPFLLIMLGSENLMSGTRWGRALAFALAAAVASGVVYFVVQGRLI